MTKGQITTALDMHGVEWREAGKGRIEAWEEATMRLNGRTVDASAWVPAPVSKSDMLAWLGY